MSKPKRANDINQPPCWKVRVALKGGVIIHVLSSCEPIITFFGNMVTDVKWDLVTGTEHGDTIGFLNLQEISAVTWRFAPLAEK